MSAYKKLSKQDLFVSDYLSYKAWTASDSEREGYGIEVLRGFSGSTPGYPYPLDLLDNRYQKLNYDSIKHNYYGNTSGSLTGYPVMTGSYDISLTSTLSQTGSRALGAEVAVISIPKEVYGIGIKPLSLRLEPEFSSADEFVTAGYASDGTYKQDYIESIKWWYGSNPLDKQDYVEPESDYVDETVEQFVTQSFFTQQRIELIDDGDGRIIVSGSTDSYTKSERVVGDIIYNQGQIIITDPILARYYSTYARINTSWISKLPIYTYNIHCTVKEYELNHTYNRTAVTGSYKNVREDLKGPEFKPYITTIGLYNEANELIAVAKTNRPIPKSHNVDMTFVVKLDI